MSVTDFDYRELQHRYYEQAAELALVKAEVLAQESARISLVAANAELMAVIHATGRAVPVASSVVFSSDPLQVRQ